MAPYGVWHMNPLGNLPLPAGKRRRSMRDRQSRAGLAELIELAQGVRGVSAEHGSSGNRRWRDYDRADRRYPPVLAAPKVTAGALNKRYDLPQVHYAGTGILPLTALAILFFAGRFALRVIRAGGSEDVMLAAWALTLAAVTVQLTLSVLDRPARVTPRVAARLARLNVVAVIPVYNEDPEILDRSIWSLANSSRPPDHIHVVEDGPSEDYSMLRAHWRQHPDVTWDQLPENQGKRCAQAHGFRAHPSADVFMTVDSDTAVEYHAVEEALKPLNDRRVMSVAFIEEIINKRVNLLTWISQTASLIIQFGAWGAQSALGDVIVNRGTCALYRASVIREIIPAYVGETFLGRPIKLGDDSALTLFARARGRTVQQVSAFSLPVYPETLYHHVRQRLRWARGSTLRHVWRLRYLSPLSYGWWFVAVYVFLTFLSAGALAVLALTWPHSALALAAMTSALALSGYATAFRALCAHRSDDTWRDRAVQFALAPVAWLWLFTALRLVRYYGIATCMRQSWVTRQHGAEVWLEHGGEPAGVADLKSQEAVV
jgi:hyaluronan synthase